MALSSFALVVNAFDPGGPPGGGGVPKVVTGNWEFINYQPTGGSYSPQFEINNENAQWLEMKWLFPYTEVDNTWSNAMGGSSAPALIVDGVVYVVKNTQALHAVDAKTGDEIWFSDEPANTWDSEAIAAEFPFFSAQWGHTHAMNYYRESGWLISSNTPCLMTAWNAEDGSLAWSIGVETLCGTVAEYGTPGGAIGTLKSKGRLSSVANHPPAFSGDTMIWPIMGASGGGGRSSVKGFDMSDPNNPVELWNTWLMPPMDGSQKSWAIDVCNEADGNGWYFSAPDFFESGTLAINCKDVPDEAVENDWINLKPGTPHYNEVHSASAMSVVWGNMPVDAELGLVYLGTGDVGPYSNASYRFGPNLFGSAIVALDVDTGKIAWWFHSNPHDLWDWDCSWGGLMAKSQGIKTLIKGCKNGMMYALNAATGEPVWVWEAPTTWRTAPGTNYGMDKDGNAGADGEACCRMTFDHMNKDWLNAPDPEPVIWNPWLAGALESDMSYNGKYIFVANYNDARWTTTGNVIDFGNQASNIQASGHPVNTTIYAVNINTGEADWSAFIPDAGFRGGLMSTGSVVYGYAGDGNLYMFDANTGELVHKRFFGVPVSVMPTIGADSDGKHKIFLHVGGGGGFVYGNTAVEGSLVALGLPDTLPSSPEPIIQIEEREVERIVEIIEEVVVDKEVEVERIVEIPVEVIKEVEVVTEVTVPGGQSISPISYIAIGIGVVLIVVAGVLFQRSRST